MRSIASLTCLVLGLTVGLRLVSASIEALNKQLDGPDFDTNMAKVRSLSSQADCKSCLGSLFDNRALLKKLVRLEEAGKAADCHLSTMEFAQSVGKEADFSKRRPTDYLIRELLKRYAIACRETLFKELKSREARVEPETGELVQSVADKLLQEFMVSLWTGAGSYPNVVAFVQRAKLGRPFWPIWRAIKAAVKTAGDGQAELLFKSFNPSDAALRGLFNRYIIEPCKDYVRAIRPYGVHAVFQFGFVGEEEWQSTGLDYAQTVLNYHSCVALIDKSKVLLKYFIEHLPK